jgi:hypothetical protein
VLRISGPKRVERIEGWRKLRNEELNNIHSLPNIFRMIKSRRMKWAGHVAHMGQQNECRILVGQPEGKRPLERPKHRRVDNILVCPLKAETV